MYSCFLSFKLFSQKFELVSPDFEIIRWNFDSWMATVFVFYFLQWQKKASIQQADVSALSKEKTQTLKGKNSVKHTG